MNEKEQPPRFNEWILGNLMKWFDTGIYGYELEIACMEWLVRFGGIIYGDNPSDRLNDLSNRVTEAKRLAKAIREIRNAKLPTDTGRVVRMKR